MLAIQRAIRKNADYQLMQGQKEFGMNVSRLVSPFGELVLKTHPLFNELTSGSDYAAVDSWLIVVDQQELHYRYVDDTQYQAKLQDNGLDGLQSGYLTEAGLEVHFPTAHYILKNVSNGIVDA